MGKNNKKKTHNEFLEQIYELVGSDFTVLSKYVNSKTKVKFIHNCDDCGNYEFDMTPNAFITQGQRCKKCGIKRRTDMKAKSHEEFLKDFYNIFNEDEYSVVGDYKNSHTRIEIVHRFCGSINKVFPYNLLQGKSTCLKCKIENHNMNMRKPHEKFEEEMNQLSDGEYTLIGEYKSALSKVLVKHNLCNHEYYVNPNKFLLGRRCPRCKQSKGEKKVSRVLTSLNEKFETEYTFKDCKNKYVLPFDFMVYKDDSLYAIEFHGEQHYKAFDYYGGEKAFEYRKNNDSIKKKYCEKNGIKFLEIPYWDYENIENIIIEYLKKTT